MRRYSYAMMVIGDAPTQQAVNDDAVTGELQTRLGIAVACVSLSSHAAIIISHCSSIRNQLLTSWGFN